MPKLEIQGSILRFTFRSEETGFTIAKIQYQSHGEKETAVVGTFPVIDVGEVGIFKGEWVKDSKHGWQFKADSYENIVPTTEKGIQLLLEKGRFKGVGPTLAKRIVERFGRETIFIIEKNPKMLSEVQGVSPKVVDKIHESWMGKKTMKEVRLLFAEIGEPLFLTDRIYKVYREKTLINIKKRPYDIVYDVYGVGFKTADRVALKQGFKEDSPDRIQATLYYILTIASEEGHTYLQSSELIEQSAEYLGINLSEIEPHLSSLAKLNKVILEEDRVYLRSIYTDERTIAERVSALLENAVKFEVKAVSDQIREIEELTRIKYSEMQERALTEAITQKFLVITGGPGTGKTTIVRALIELCKNQDLGVMLAAPTGRAAKRMEEACNHDAKTIHRLLEFDPQEFKFVRNQKTPLGADVVIIDETSMIDTSLMASLLNGISNDSRVILVGDIDQLPSVGAGNILHDLIASNVIPVVKLDVVFRQDETSDIIIAAHDINRGEAPKFMKHDENTYFFMVENDNELLPQRLVDVVSRRLPNRYKFDPARDIQVLTPMYKASAGAINLNYLLQKALNRSTLKIGYGDRVFHTGDKVMQLRNNYDKNVFNGDIGFISFIDLDENVVTVSFDGVGVKYEKSELGQLTLAYAVTVHKSQGSEYPVVVMPVTTQHFIMLQKNLLYTAATRAKEMLVLIGSYKALNISVKNDKPSQRNTFLTERLKDPAKYSSHQQTSVPLD